MLSDGVKVSQDGFMLSRMNCIIMGQVGKGFPLDSVEEITYNHCGCKHGHVCMLIG